MVLLMSGCTPPHGTILRSSDIQRVPQKFSLVASCQLLWSIIRSYVRIYWLWELWMLVPAVRYIATVFENSPTYLAFSFGWYHSWCSPNFPGNYAFFIPHLFSLYWWHMPWFWIRWYGYFCWAVVPVLYSFTLHLLTAAAPNPTDDIRVVGINDCVSPNLVLSCSKRGTWVQVVWWMCLAAATWLDIT